MSIKGGGGGRECGEKAAIPRITGGQEGRGKRGLVHTLPMVCQHEEGGTSN